MLRRPLSDAYPLGRAATDPALLFIDGVQVDCDVLALPRIPLTKSAQVRMCGNSVPPPLSEALVRANFGHEREIARAA